MSERTENVTPPVVGKTPPGSPHHDEEKVGKLPSGRTVRKVPTTEPSSSEEGSISRLSKETIAPPPASKQQEEKHSITRTGEKSPSEERMEKTRQATLPLTHSTKDITSSAGTLPPSIQELVETSLYPDMPLPGQPKGLFTILERMSELDVPGVSMAVINNELYGVRHVQVTP